MTYFEAVECASQLAADYGVRLGDCLFADADIPLESWWFMNFDIVDGPADWCWLVWVNEAQENMGFLAIHRRPPASLAPPVGLLPRDREVFERMRRSG